MADNTDIEWSDATWNVVTGCAVVSPGCTNCYAMKLAGTRLQHHPSRAGLTQMSKAGPVWTGEVRFNEQWLDQPLRWKRPRRIFVAAHGDLFHEAVPDEVLDEVFAIMALCPQHTFQVLTKRSKRMREYLRDPNTPFRVADMATVVGRHLPDGHPGWQRGNWRASPIIGCTQPANWPLTNVWIGVSVEDQTRADERIPDLLATPTAIRFVSAEPLLGPVDFLAFQEGIPGNEWLTWLDGIDWIIVGGESGPDARPMHPDWARSIRDQCAAAGTAFFFKQWGEWAPQVGAVDGWNIDDNPEISRFDHRDWEGGHWGEPYRPMWCDEVDDDTVSRIGKSRAGRLLDGVEHNAMPEVAR
ncbi:phage Gp37/Gp68 family protein [Stappia sp. F7233]|uniref:Phage Gp37/Gp68 family protein n=1 Tax=Stappia albiluteola TaxID=2758565 RepID=A0A839AH28_9HYPH|nr:phage Gp37/Gp68 family protein [Stappia albiluteola]MBA5778234.1 phage Gp37/Gp68 family protein [Stappia albiluteola]